MIEFEENIEWSRFFDPSDGERKREKIVVRKDPLTGKSSRILEKPLPISKEVEIEEDIKGGFCPFCSENIYDIGARDSEVLDDEILEKGEAVLLANISPYAERSLVIRLSEDHYLPLDSFTEEHFTDAFELTLNYLDEDNKIEHASLMMNYLKPAGSTVVHPHIQILASDDPMDYQKRVLEACERYHENTGENYWKDLLSEEREGERYVGETGVMEWISPFAPRGLEHIQGIALKNFMNFERKDLKDLSLGIVNTLLYYSSIDLNSFNISMMPLLGEKEVKATVVDIVARSNFDKYYWCDVFALTKLLEEPYSHKYPKEIADEAGRHFE